MRILLILSASLLATPAAAQDRGISWGKPGVSFERYRQDASDCGHKAWYEDVSKTEAAEVFKRASRQLELSDLVGDGMEIGIRSARIVEGTRPEKRIKEVRTLQYDVLAKCLTERGYVRFRLTKQQMDGLKRLRRGTDKRHNYLYSLATNRWVIEMQRI